MWNDVVDLREFYDTRLGQVARHMIRRAVRSMWEDVSGQRLLGLGYATPYLRQFRGEAERVLAFMPAPQGVVHWPPEGPGTAALIDETELPLPDFSVDRVLLVHSFENCEFLRDMLREVWRVMSNDGRLLVVAPNRTGIWARADRTPFGWGRPYSRTQLSHTLRDNMFTPARSNRALYIPPTRSHALLRAAPAWERVGGRLFPRFSGVVMMEASKQLYAGSAVRAQRGLRKPALVQFPQTAPPGLAGRVRDDTSD